MTVPNRGVVLELPQRKPTRLKAYDYTNQNFYYITICTDKKQHLFGKPGQLHEFGKIAEQELIALSSHFAGIKAENYVVMPNHVHAIIRLGCKLVTERSRPFPTLSTVVGLYKSGVTKQIHRINPQIRIWQKSFYDHVIRGKRDYQEIRAYIDNNSIKWKEDAFYTQG